MTHKTLFMDETELRKRHDEYLKQMISSHLSSQKEPQMLFRHDNGERAEYTEENGFAFIKYLPHGHKTCVGQPLNSGECRVTTAGATSIVFWRDKKPIQIDICGETFRPETFITLYRANPLNNEKVEVSMDSNGRAVAKVEGIHIGFGMWGKWSTEHRNGKVYSLVWSRARSASDKRPEGASDTLSPKLIVSDYDETKIFQK